MAGITSPETLAAWFPRHYHDRRTVVKIQQLQGRGEEATVSGKITMIREAGFGRKKRLEAVLQDETGQLKVVWFKGISYFRKILAPNAYFALSGKVKRYGRYLSMAHPETDQLTSPEETGHSALTGIIPVYPGNQHFAKAYITSALIRKWILFALKKLDFPEFLPEKLMHEMGFPDRNTAFRNIHAPENPADHRIALERFKFEELFLFELSVMSIKKVYLEKTDGHVLNKTSPCTTKFFNQSIPFDLTAGQKASLTEIRKDLASGRCMNRLLQGDVGSGKTIVAIGAMLLAIDNGYQAAMMAPTEILAEQHYHTLNTWLNPLGLNIRLLTGNQKKKLRLDILSDIEGGGAHIVVGTHAIIQETVRFHRLGIVVIDEQHRFGVSQRAALRQKGNQPHILVMSATPIPRSLAMAVYSDLDISIIRDLPPGRKPVITRVIRERERESMNHFLHEQMQAGSQIYVVYPLIEESEALDLKNATDGYRQICQSFPGVHAGLLHGKMPQAEKESVMRDFKSGRIQILVSTTVIEVGVDVPNAAVMLIEHAERFGLSQLHQLRGRIGRGQQQSYCLLMSHVRQSRDARNRLKTMLETSDGFKIAEADLKLRGPGDFLGTRQSGLPEFRYADIIQDQYLLQTAKNAAIDLLYVDPEIRRPEHARLRKIFLPVFENKKKFFQIS